MKKIITLTIVSIISFFAFQSEAQVRFGIKGGVNISKVHFSDKVFDSSNLTGFQVGPVVEIMAPYTGFGVETGILYSQKGMEVDDESFSADYLDIPVSFKWKMGLPVVKPYLVAGPYFGFRVGGDKIWKIPGNVSGDIKTKNFNTGLNIGAGAEVFKHLQVGINYAFALTDNYESETIEAGSGKNRTWSITAAIIF